MISRSEKVRLILRAILYIIAVTLYCIFREMKHKAMAALPNISLFFKHTADDVHQLTSTTSSSDYPYDYPFNTTTHIFMQVDGFPSLSPIPNHILNKAIKLTLPIIHYGVEDKEDSELGDGGACVVCWECLQRTDEIRDLPNCRHVFHRDCLDKWVDVGQITCPLCRSMLLPPLTNPWAVVRQEDHQQQQQQQQIISQN